MEYSVAVRTVSCLRLVNETHVIAVPRQQTSLQALERVKHMQGGSCLISVQCFIKVTCVQPLTGHSACAKRAPYPETPLQSPIQNLLLPRRLCNGIEYLAGVKSVGMMRIVRAGPLIQIRS